MTAGRRWCVYVLACADGTLYTGVTTDLTARMAAHSAGRGARYTRGRGPFRVVFVHRRLTHGGALRREHAIKQLSREDKDALCLAHAARRQAA